MVAMRKNRLSIASVLGSIFKASVFIRISSASRLEAIALRLEAISIGLEAIAIRFLLLLGSICY